MTSQRIGAFGGIVFLMVSATVALAESPHQKEEVAAAAAMEQAEQGAGGHGMPSKRFYSWEGSKRQFTEPSKRKFYAWAGKRSGSEGPGVAAHEADMMEKRKFYAWAGKRSGGSSSSGEQHHPHEESEEGPAAEKRKFYAWAGKRSSGEAAHHSGSPEEMHKRKFYAWAGKRSLQAMSPEDRDLEKRKFYAWAGKRSSGEQQHHNVPSAHHSEDKRKFYAWAGRK